MDNEKRAYNEMINRNTRQDKQEYKDKRKEACKIFSQKREYC
jgi:hypothetical protein